MNIERAHELAREKGVNPIVYWIVRAILQPSFHVYFRLHRIGIEHIPAAGPVLIAANHRSFSDPFFLGTCLRRPLRFVAKAELFEKRWQAHLLLALGAFPIRRGESDELAMETARVILECGGVVGIFPEGTRVRPGPLGEPKRGVGRLALETGAAIVPAAIVGTGDIRNGWRIRPRRVSVRCGRPVTYPAPAVGQITTDMAREVTRRAWSCVELQWESLGGVAPVRSVAVIGAGSWGTAVAVTLARGGASVQLGSRTAEQAEALRLDGANERYLPGIALPELVRPVAASQLDLDGVDVVCLAVPARALPQALDGLENRLPPQAGVLILSKGLVAPDGALPCDVAAAQTGERPIAFLGGPAHAGEAASIGAGFVLACADPTFAWRLAGVLRHAGHIRLTSDLIGVQLAGCAKNAAALAASSALPAGVNAAGVAAGRVFEECHALAIARGALPETFAGPAGTGDLVATVLASQSRNRRAGELLARGAVVEEIERELGQVAEALDLVPLLAAAMGRAGIDAPATRSLAFLIKAPGGEQPAEPARAQPEPVRVA